MQNPFLRVLRASFEGLYRHAAGLGEKATVLVPCAECLEGESFNQVFMETHVLQATHVPCCFMNLLGQGVEIRDASVTTDLGFADHRKCAVMQSESMYDFGSTFSVLVIDKPLLGRYRTLPSGSAERAAAKSSTSSQPAVGTASSTSLGATATAGGGVAWLNQAPDIEDSFYEQLLQFRRTFVQVPGCEQSTSERIREIVGDTTKRLIRHHGLVHPTQQRQLDYQVSRNAYAVLHSFVFPHLQKILGAAEKRLDRAIRSFESCEELLKVVPGVAGRGFGSIDVRSCSAHLAAMDKEITPHEKILCINEAHSALQQCVADSARAAQAASGGNTREAAIEITGDDILSLFILAVFGSAFKDRMAHIAYVEMYLQGAAGRSGSNEAARFEEAGYAVSALQAALAFFLEDSRRNVASNTGALGRGNSRGMGTFQSPGGYPSGSVGRQGGRGGLGVAAFGDIDDPVDHVNSQLQGIVRQARGQR